MYSTGYINVTTSEPSNSKTVEPTERDLPNTENSPSNDKTMPKNTASSAAWGGTHLFC